MSHIEPLQAPRPPRLTKIQIANIRDALDVMWPSVPGANVVPGLGAWRFVLTNETATCNTVACFGGWCAVWPAFQAQGVKPSNTGIPLVRSWPPTHKNAADFLFGDPTLFYARNHHRFDRGFTGSDHALVTHRLQKHLQEATTW